MRRGATRALVASLLLVMAGVALPTPAAVAAPSACSASAIAQPDRVWGVADARLAALARPALTIPFGATGRQQYQRTTAYAWTSGFYPASLWLMYERTKARSWLTLARTYTLRILPTATWTGTHDLGFMVGLPAGLGLRLDPSERRRDQYRAAIIAAARSLSTRWNGHVGAIKSGEYSGRWGLIIDSAMNAPLLLQAAAMLDGAESRHLEARGLRHLLTLAEQFVRPDGSTVHRQVFNPESGSLIGPVAGQGLSTGSSWARGQAWAINGFAQGYALSGEPRLLEAARRTADYWIDHVGTGCVPAWDLDITSATAPRDTSAAAIAADGLLALARVDPDPVLASAYLAAGMQALATLTQPAWVPEGKRDLGVLQHQAYSIPGDPREGTYVWGDAYLLHALAASG